MRHISGVRRVRVTALLAVAVAVLAGACGGGDVGDAARARSTRRTTTTEAPTTTTTTTAAVARPSGAATTPIASPKFGRAVDAVRHLYEAWRKGDRNAAAAAATGDAVNQLFARQSAELSGSECTRPSGDTRCFMDGDGYSVIFEVASSSSRGYRVTGVSFATHTAADDPPGAPTAVATPSKAAVGDTVRLEGSGFVGDPWEAEDAPLYLVGGDDDCALYAIARDTLVVENGKLTGTFVVPATGDCRMTGREEAVTPGRYDLAYSCTACVVGELTVVSGS